MSAMERERGRGREAMIEKGGEERRDRGKGMTDEVKGEDEKDLSNIPCRS